MIVGIRLFDKNLERCHVFRNKFVQIRHARFVTTTQEDEFRKLSIDKWRDVAIQKRFMEWAWKQLNINNPSDWYRVTHSVIALKFDFCLRSRISDILVETYF